MNQTDLFMAGEADGWFRRNMESLTIDGPKTDWPCRLVLDSGFRPARVLEVGAANGYRLEKLRRLYGCTVCGVEPSAEAVAVAGREFPQVDMRRGVAHDLAAFADASFDLVVINFVLHWVERSLLFRTAAEADRVLADGGQLVIGDFAPDRPQRVRYHHRPEAEVYTYKQDYPAFWLASGLYVYVSDVVLDHAANEPAADVPSAHRVRVTLLRKSGAANYPTVSLP